MNFSNVRERTSKNIVERPVMKKNAYVTIIASPELSEMRLDELVGAVDWSLKTSRRTEKRTGAALYCWKKSIWMNFCGSSPKNQYHMSRLNRILLATVLLLCSILWLQHRRTIRLTEERDRFRMNSTALLSDVSGCRSIQRRWSSMPRHAADYR